MNLNLRDISSKLSPRGWLAVGGSVLVGIIFIFLLMSFASSPSYSTIAAGQNPAQAAKETAALSAAGITNELLNGGTAVAVEASKVGQARDVLSTAGLLAGSSPSLESLLGTSSLGADSQQQQEQETSAVEQQLDQYIEQMNGVTSAQVALQIPNNTVDLFAGSNTQPSASVLLETGAQFGSSSPRAIAQMVAGAVNGLKADKVTITDQNGDILWPAGQGSGSASAASTQTADTNYDTSMAAKADAYLAATVGANKALVEVNADLNNNQQQTSSLIYGKTGTPASANLGNEKLTGTPTTASATGNTATQLSSVAGKGTSGNSNYTNKTSKINYDVNKKVTQTTVAPGGVNSQTIAVLVSSSVPQSEIPVIKNAVETTLGFKPGRDKISVGSVTFPKLATAAASSSSSKMMGDVKYVLVGVGMLAFLFFMRRALRRSESEQFAGNPTWLRELNAPRALSELEARTQMIDPDGGAPVNVARLRPPVNVARQQVEELVDRDPERVASHIRQWMSED